MNTLVPEIGVLLRHEIDHVIAQQHGGETNLENLAFACFHCNRHKGTNLATVGSAAVGIVRLFNPRLDDWGMHFKRDGITITGCSEIGEATVRLLHLNSPHQIRRRRVLMDSGLWHVGE